MPNLTKLSAEQHFNVRSALGFLEEELQQLEQWFVSNERQFFLFACGVVLSVLLCLLIRFVIRRGVVPVLAHVHPIFSKALYAASGSLARLFLWLAFSGCFDLIHFPGKGDEYVDKFFSALFILSGLNILLQILNCTGKLLHQRVRSQQPALYGMQKMLLDLSGSILRLAIWGGGIIFILQDVFQLNVMHILASVGILGLAIAFAAQNTIANLFGAFSIVGSRLFKVGDWIKLNGYEGHVEEIGFRSTRLRAFNGRMIDVPNRLIADAQLENFSERLYWREHFCYGLVYQTSPEEIQHALQIIEEIGQDLSELMVPGKPVHFVFLNCGSSSLDLDGYVWFKAETSFSMREARSRFNLEVLRRFNAAGLDFAYPTTTVLLEK